MIDILTAAFCALFVHPGKPTGAVNRFVFLRVIAGLAVLFVVIGSLSQASGSPH